MLLENKGEEICSSSGKKRKAAKCFQTNKTSGNILRVYFYMHFTISGRNKTRHYKMNTYYTTLHPVDG